MKTFQKINTFTKLILLTGLLLIIYGYTCRLAGLYFFWESRSIGWMVFILGIIGLLWYRVKIKKHEKAKAIPEKIGIWILIFILFVQSVLMIVLPLTDAYAVAKKYLVNDDALVAEIGMVKGISLMSTGSIQIENDLNGETGNAVINMTVKGDKKFKDITIYVVKYANNEDWKVEEVE